jgi:hypothetical protein
VWLSVLSRYDGVVMMREADNELCKSSSSRTQSLLGKHVFTCVTTSKSLTSQKTILRRLMMCWKFDIQSRDDPWQIAGSGAAMYTHLRTEKINVPDWLHVEL